MSNFDRPKASRRFKADMVGIMAIITLPTGAFVTRHARREILKYKARTEAKTKINRDTHEIAVDLVTIKTQGGFFP